MSYFFCWIFALMIRMCVWNVPPLKITIGYAFLYPPMVLPSFLFSIAKKERNCKWNLELLEFHIRKILGLYSTNLNQFQRVWASHAPGYLVKVLGNRPNIAHHAMINNWITTLIHFCNKVVCAWLKTRLLRFFQKSMVNSSPFEHDWKSNTHKIALVRIRRW